MFTYSCYECTVFEGDNIYYTVKLRMALLVQYLRFWLGKGYHVEIKRICRVESPDTSFQFLKELPF